MLTLHFIIPGMPNQIPSLGHMITLALCGAVLAVLDSYLLQNKQRPALFSVYHSHLNPRL